MEPSLWSSLRVREAAQCSPLDAVSSVASSEGRELADLLHAGSDSGQVIDCIFCRRDDESLNQVLAENQTCFARLDNFPATKGHVEVLPKRHVASFFDLSGQEVQDAYELLRKIQRDIADEISPDGYTIGVNEGRAAGRTVDHLHIHLIPRHSGDVPDPRGGVRQVVPNCYPDRWASS